MKCIKCSNPNEPGHTRCKHHLEKHRLESIQYRKKYLEQGCCQRCGYPMHEELDKDYKSCSFCRERTGDFLRLNEA